MAWHQSSAKPLSKSVMTCTCVSPGLCRRHIYIYEIHKTRLAAPKYIFFICILCIICKVQHLICTHNRIFRFLCVSKTACTLFFSYEPELFPGLIYRMVKPRIVLLIFVSGKVVLTGWWKKELKMFSSVMLPSDAIWWHRFGHHWFSQWHLF